MICIIPARRNSKGLKNKNIKKLNGIPLIAHTINVAKKSKQIKKIYLSTDDERIIRLFKNDRLVNIPYVRPKNLSGDHTDSVDVYLHMINFIEKDFKFNEFCVLLPTCPIRDVSQIDDAIKIFKKNKVNFLISVVETKPLEFQFRINENSFIKKTSNIKFKVSNKKKLHKKFIPNWSIYIFNKK